MKKKILIGSIIAVALLTLVSFSSVVGYNSVENNPDSTPIEFKLLKIRELVRSINLHKIIVNPDAVVKTLEEVSSIIEENEDCGCEDDNSDLDWNFPTICTLLLPLWGIAVWLYFLSNRLITQPMQIMSQIGDELNCYWF